jgi:hypothetical protein
MSLSRPRRLLLAASAVTLVALAVVLVTLPASAEEAKHLAQYRMIAMTSAGPGAVQGAVEYQLTVDQWSSAEERAALIMAYEKGGNLALYETLQKQPSHGYISRAGGLGYQVRYVHLADAAKGHKLVVVNDTFVGPVNFDANSEFLKYPITLIEMALDDQGNGTGTMVVGARILAGKDGVLKVETNGQAPIALTKIWKVK